MTTTRTTLALLALLTSACFVDSMPEGYTHDGGGTGSGTGSESSGAEDSGTTTHPSSWSGEGSAGPSTDSGSSTGPWPDSSTGMWPDVGAPDVGDPGPEPLPVDPCDAQCGTCLDISGYAACSHGSPCDDGFEPTPESNLCYLPCADDLDCPEGTVCVWYSGAHGMFAGCLWPV